MILNFIIINVYLSSYMVCIKIFFFKFLKIIVAESTGINNVNLKFYIILNLKFFLLYFRKFFSKLKI